MAFKDLCQFISFLEKKGELIRIKTPVSCELEITEITDRACKSSSGNLALLFEQVEGYDIPIVTNLFGSYSRMAWALGVKRLDDLQKRVSELIKPDMPTTLLDKLQRFRQLAELARFQPQLVQKAPCQEVVITDNPSISKLPILKCWPEDGGRFITMPLVFTKDPITERRNVGMYRLQVYDDQTLGLHWHIHKHGAKHFAESQKQGKLMEVAIAIGGDPATVYSATAPLPEEIDEMLFAGWLRKSRVPMVKAKTVDLEVPAEAEFVLEGYVEPDERRLEGPFGDHTGYYSLPDEYPVFHLRAITHRRNPIYLATIVGKPPMEDYYMGKATERLFLPLLRLVLPEVVDINMPMEGVFHNLLIVSINKSYPGQPQKVMHGIWGLMLMMLTKAIVVVDAEIDVHNLSDVLWRVTNNVDPKRDILIAEGPLDALDHSSPVAHFGSKVGIDATRKTPNDGHNRPWPGDVVMSEDIKRRVDEKLKQLGIPGLEQGKGSSR